MVERYQYIKALRFDTDSFRFLPCRKISKNQLAVLIKRCATNNLQVVA